MVFIARVAVTSIAVASVRCPRAFPRSSRLSSGPHPSLCAIPRRLAPQDSKSPTRSSPLVESVTLQQAS